MHRQTNIKSSYEPMTSTCSDLVPQAVHVPPPPAPHAPPVHVDLYHRPKKKKGKKKLIKFFAFMLEMTELFAENE